MTDVWDREEFDALLPTMARVVVLFHADWCPFSRAFLPLFEAAEPETSVPMVRTDLRHPRDARWTRHGLRVVPTVAYYEHGEELERREAPLGVGMDGDDLWAFLEAVEALQEQWRPRHGRLQVDRTG